MCGYVCLSVIYECLTQENSQRYGTGFFRYSADKTLTETND